MQVQEKKNPSYCLPRTDVLVVKRRDEDPLPTAVRVLTRQYKPTLMLWSATANLTLQINQADGASQNICFSTPVKPRCFLWKVLTLCQQTRRQQEAFLHLQCDAHRSSKFSENTHKCVLLSNAKNPSRSMKVHWCVTHAVHQYYVYFRNTFLTCFCCAVPVCVYIQRSATPRGSSPPAQQPLWRWPALCLPAGAWSRWWVTAAPCTPGRAGGLDEKPAQPPRKETQIYFK